MSTFTNRTCFGQPGPATKGHSLRFIVIALGFVMLPPELPQRDAVVRTPFLALVASEAMAAEPAVIVSPQVAAATLSEYGLPVDPARADEVVRAEFLLSPTGLAWNG